MARSALCKCVLKHRGHKGSDVRRPLLFAAVYFSFYDFDFFWIADISSVWSPFCRPFLCRAKRGSPFPFPGASTQAYQLLHVVSPMGTLTAVALKVFLCLFMLHTRHQPLSSSQASSRILAHHVQYGSPALVGDSSGHNAKRAPLPTRMPRFGLRKQFHLN